MISRIKLQNFLSYSDVTISLNGSTIAVVGDNGVGKSSLLEAIPYALFGIGRETMEGMSRINGDGTHQVTLWDSDGYEIRRGRKKNGQGYFEIYSNNVLVVKGREADEWVKSYLGMDGDLFMLTAFFGLHDVRHDTLIKVTPANRLEALQKLAEIGPYKKLLMAAKEALKNAEIAKGNLESKKEGAEAAMVDEDDIKRRIFQAEQEVSDSEKQYQKLMLDRDALMVEEERYKAVVKEKSELLTVRQSLDTHILSLENERQGLVTAMADNKTASTNVIVERDRLKLPKMVPSDEQSVVDNLNASLGVADGRVALLTTVVDSDLSVNDCPLCSSKVADNQIAIWREELSDLRSKIVSIKRDVRDRKSRIAEFVRIESRLVELKSTMAIIVTESELHKARLAEVDQELRKLQSTKQLKDTRFIDIQEILGEKYQRLHEDISRVNGKIDAVTSAIAAGNREITIYRNQLRGNVATKKKICEYDAGAKKYALEMKSAKLLTEAWSRYGIPMRLIQDIMDSIEEKATLVYQEFDSGRIEVKRVTDRGKQGVEFTLNDRKGSRTFNQLSAGEKVMFFIAVRVAISQIISSNRKVAVDYLVLDEAMGNLSPKRRDDLVRLINKVLRKMFPQVLMVSHTEMRDIFTQTLRVTADGGSSEVSVI